MSSEAPTKMSIGDAARLDRANLHIRRLNEEIQAYQAEIAEVLATYQIDPKDPSVRVNMKTGEITRAAPGKSP